MLVTSLGGRGERLELMLKVLADSFHRLLLGERVGIYPTFEFGARICLDDVWRIVTDTETDYEDGRGGSDTISVPPIDFVVGRIG